VYQAAEVVTAALLCALIILLVVIMLRAWRASRVTPDERERRRRAMLLAVGKMGDATLLEIRADLLLYSYAVRGVEYTASQDISKLRNYLPSAPSSFGPALVKYDPRNPANSIVLAEEWSGLQNLV